MVHRQHDDAGRRDKVEDLFACSDAVELRHRDVHQDHIWPQLGGEFNCLASIIGFTDDLETVFHKGAFEALANHTMIVREEHCDWHKCYIGRFGPVFEHLVQNSYGLGTERSDLLGFWCA